MSWACLAAWVLLGVKQWGPSMLLVGTAGMLLVGVCFAVLDEGFWRAMTYLAIIVVGSCLLLAVVVGGVLGAQTAFAWAERVLTTCPPGMGR